MPCLPWLWFKNHNPQTHHSIPPSPWCSVIIFSPSSPPTAHYPPKMADESIYHMFSCCVSCLQESKHQIYHFTMSQLTHHLTELQQRDRLFDSQVYLKVLDWREIWVIVQHNPEPCSSAILLLASLLQVSIHLCFPHTNAYPASLATSPLVSPSFPSRHYQYTTCILYLWFHIAPTPTTPGNSFGFNVLFALPIQSRSTLAVPLAQFIFNVSADIWAVSAGMKLWDLTFRVDHNHVFDTLQFETQVRHEKIQVEACFLTSSFISTDPSTHEFTFYHELSESSLSDHMVSTYMRQINESLRCV